MQTTERLAAWQLLGTEWIWSLSLAQLPIVVILIGRGYIGNCGFPRSEAAALAARMDLTPKRITDILRDLVKIGLVLTWKQDDETFYGINLRWRVTK